MSDYRPRPTPVPYSLKQQEQIRERMRTAGSTVLCPLCGTELRTQKVPEHGGAMLACDTCGRIMLVEDSPGQKGEMTNG